MSYQITLVEKKVAEPIHRITILHFSKLTSEVLNN